MKVLVAALCLHGLLTALAMHSDLAAQCESMEEISAEIGALETPPSEVAPAAAETVALEIPAKIFPADGKHLEDSPVRTMTEAVASCPMSVCPMPSCPLAGPRGSQWRWHCLDYTLRRIGFLRGLQGFPYEIPSRGYVVFENVPPEAAFADAGVIVGPPCPPTEIDTESQCSSSSCSSMPGLVDPCDCHRCRNPK